MSVFEPILGTPLLHKHSLADTNSYSSATKVVAPVGSGFAADYYTDGVADEVEINAATIAVNGSGGGIVLLKAGNYTTGNTVNILSNVTLQGEGYISTIITKVAGANFDAIKGNFISNASVNDIYVDGNNRNSATDGRGFYMYHVVNVTVNRCKAYDCVAGMESTGATDLTWYKCITDSNYNWNFYTFSGIRVKVLYSQSLNAKAALHEGFGMAFYVDHIACEAVGNYVYNSAGTAIEIHAGNPNASKDSTDFLCMGNYVDSCQYYGIYSLIDTPTTYLMRRLTVIGNRVTNCAGKGFYFNFASELIVDGNIAEGNGQDGLGFENCAYVTSSNNISENNSAYGFRVIGSGVSITSTNDILLNNTGGAYAPNTLTSGLQIISGGNMQLDGQTNNGIILTRQLTAATIGSSLTISGGGAYKTGTNLSGGNLFLAAGTSTGKNRIIGSISGIIWIF